MASTTGLHGLQIFFVSYAHVNRDKVLEKFVDGLCDEVIQRAPGKLHREDVKFFDSEGIQTGEQWVKKLAAVVSSYKVCVAICSPAFVSSEFCGKELRVFMERLEQWQNSSQNTGKIGRAIIPVIWVKASLPDILKKFQYDEAAFPDDYREQGLRTLYQLNKYRDKRTRVLITLAERIIKAATETDLPPIASIPHFDSIPSVFHEQRRGTRYGVALVALVKAGISGLLYENGPTLSAAMDAASAMRIPWRALELDGKLKQRLQEAKDSREAVLVVADLETLQNPLFRKVIEDVDAEPSEHSALLIIRRDPGSGSGSAETNVEITLTGLLKNVFAKAQLRDLNSIYSGESLCQRLEEVITKLRQGLVAEEPARKADDTSIVAAAAAEGIPIARQPALTGPGATMP